jgi:hypothetical protein
VYSVLGLKGIQQNFLNPISNKFRNPGNPALEESSPKTISFAFYEQKASSMKQADLWNLFGRASMSACT